MSPYYQPTDWLSAIKVLRLVPADKHAQMLSKTSPVFASKHQLHGIHALLQAGMCNGERRTRQAESTVHPRLHEQLHKV